MGKRAKDGACLQALVRMAVPLLRKAERLCPRTGPGAKPEIPDWFVGTLIMVAIVKQKKTKSAQFRFLMDWNTQSHFECVLGECRFPSRSTFFRRYRRAHTLFQEAIRLQGEKAIAEGVADPRDVAVDKSLIAAHGPVWHKRDRNKGKKPRGVDVEAAWGYSKHDGWVYGYSYEVVVSSTPKSQVFPLLASAAVASASETKTFSQKVEILPEATRHVFADSGYDANHLGERVEYLHGRRTGRRYLCPENPRNHGRAKCNPGGADAARASSRALRAKRKQFFESPRGRRLYVRRSKTVEPFNSWLKSQFEMETHAWHRGLCNNQTQILAAIFAYQLLVRYNHRRGRKNARLRWITDTL